MQYGRTSVVAVDRLLRLLLPGHGNVFRIVFWHPLRPIGCDCDNQRLLVFRKHGVASEIHDLSPFCVPTQVSASVRCLKMVRYLCLNIEAPWTDKDGNSSYLGRMD